jgi:hypothetical protein
VWREDICAGARLRSRNLPQKRETQSGESHATDICRGHHAWSPQTQHGSDKRLGLFARDHEHDSSVRVLQNVRLLAGKQTLRESAAGAACVANKKSVSGTLMRYAGLS